MADVKLQNEVLCIHINIATAEMYCEFAKILMSTAKYILVRDSCIVKTHSC